MLALRARPWRRTAGSLGGGCAQGDGNHARRRTRPQIQRGDGVAAEGAGAVVWLHALKVEHPAQCAAVHPCVWHTAVQLHVTQQRQRTTWSTVAVPEARHHRAWRGFEAWTWRHMKYR